jgi:hypothetical protein
MAFDDAFSQAEANAQTFVLGGKKWSEDPPYMVLGNAMSGVTDLELHPMPVRQRLAA